MRSQESRDWYGNKMEAQNVQLFRERLSKNVHVTIPKGIVGGFAFTQVLQGNLKEWHQRPWTYRCWCQKKAAKVGSTATVY